jgi:RHS repeat-associated protein
MRQGPAGQAGTVTYLHGDHLGSTSLTTDAGGAVTARVLYYPYGEERYREGALQTDYQFTGQRREGFGLYDYQARFYDHALGRFISADTIVPGTENPQSWNRYAYVLNNPMLHVDPTGHMPGYNCADGYCRGRASNAPKKEEKAADVTPEAGPLPSITIYASAGASEGLAALALPHVYPDDPPPPPEGEQQHESDSLRLSAVGWRVDVSAGAILGGDLDVDFLLNFHDLRNIHANVSIVPGGQVEFLGGAGASTGPLFVFNLPENEDLDGWGWRVGGTAYPEIGMEIEVFGPLSDQEGDPFGVYVGFGGGEEVCGYGGVSYAFDITDWFMGVAATPD